MHKLESHSSFPDERKKVESFFFLAKKLQEEGKERFFGIQSLFVYRFCTQTYIKRGRRRRNGTAWRKGYEKKLLLLSTSAAGPLAVQLQLASHV